MEVPEHSERERTLISGTGHLPIAIVLATLGGLLSGSPVAADPPDRAARISFLSGAVSFWPATADEWTDALLNCPLTTGDALWADRAGRAEVQMGDAVARLGPDTSFSILNLDNRLAQVLSAQYVSPDTIGYADLDEFGRWRDVVPYGSGAIASVTLAAQNEIACPRRTTGRNSFPRRC